MENKINTVFLVEYSKDLSKKLIESKLQEKQFVTGPDIIKFCEIPQINFFVLRNLFQKWLEEREKLRVPFFDYSSPEVKIAIQTYLDTLSHHIKLDKDLFQKLLETAIYETLELVLSPFSFFKNKVVHVVDGKVIKGEIKNEIKYFKYNKIVLEDLTQEMSNFPHTEVNSEDYFDILHEIIQKDDTQLINPKVVIEDFNKIAPVSIEDVIIDYTSKKERTIIPDTSISEPTHIEETNPSLNDKFKAAEVKPLHETLAKKEGKGLYQSLNLNERFLFAKELFLDNQETLKLVSEKIKEFDSYDEAKLYLLENYASENDWFEKEEIESQFLNKISYLFD